jgi:predicted GH43/DUF377 family glycosyl hydrolase
MEIVDIKTDNLANADFHFNGSIFQKDGRLYLAYRANVGFSDVRIHITRLSKTTLQPEKFSKMLAIPNPGNGEFCRYEDPRMFWFKDELYCAYTFMREDRPAQCQGVAKLDKDFNVVNTWYVDYGTNHNQALKPVRVIGTPEGAVLELDPGTKFEKNWQFFEYGGFLHVSYDLEEHVVLKLDDDFKVIHEERGTKSVTWDYGRLSGGTPPVLLEGQYFTFFHSSLPENSVRTYWAGVLSFNAIAPFEITQISKKPLLSADKADKTVLWKNTVVFPCGAYYNDGEWVISYGHNDYCLKLLKISHAELLTTLQYV